MPSQNSRFETAEGDIWQHTVNNNDYDESELLYRRLRINDIPDEQFARFLEACVNPLATRDPKRIEKVVALFNGYLKNDGFIIQAAGQISGRTIYKVASAAGPGSLGKAYEVALSFAGEDRKYVEKVAAFVRGRNQPVSLNCRADTNSWMLEAADGAAHYVDADTPGFCWAGRELVLGLANDPDVVPSKARKTATKRATGRWPSRVEAASLIYKDAWAPDRPELRSSVLFTPQCDGCDLSFFV